MNTNCYETLKSEKENKKLKLYLQPLFKLLIKKFKNIIPCSHFLKS